MEKQSERLEGKENSSGITQDQQSVLNITKPGQQPDSYGQSTKWSSFFKKPSTSLRELEHFQLPSGDPQFHVEIEEEDTSAAKLNWGILWLDILLVTVLLCLQSNIP